MSLSFITFDWMLLAVVAAWSDLELEVLERVS